MNGTLCYTLYNIYYMSYYIDNVQLEIEVELRLTVKSDFGWIWSFGLKFETSFSLFSISDQPDTREHDLRMTMK